jgi:adenosylmethionine-8-amino-7-oxononanoate aminotransferase
MDYVNALPDMMCLSSIDWRNNTHSDYYLPKKYLMLYDEDINKALSGHTFITNPTGCAAAFMSLELLNTPEMQANLVR